MSFVLDASIALSWCFKDEETPITLQILRKLETEIAFVPSIWTLELGNILINAQRRSRISFAGVTQFLNLISHLNINIEEETGKKGFHEIFALAHSEGLTTYDAAYLEISLRKGIPLASKDIQLCKVASNLGVELINPL